MNAVSGWERKNIMGLVSDETSGHHRIAKADYKTQGKTPVVDQSMDFIAGYTDEESSLLDPPYVVFGDHTREIKHLEQPFLPGAQGVRIFKVNKDIDSKFMYYYLVSNKVQNLGYSRHFKLFKQIEVPLPPLAEQQRIAEILDLTSTITHQVEKQLSLLANMSMSYANSCLVSERTSPLSEFGTFSGGMTPSKKNSEYWGGTVRWFTTKDLKKSVLKDSIDHVTEQALEGTSLKCIPSPSIAFSLRGMSLAHTVPMSRIPSDSAVNQDLKAFVPHNPDGIRVLYALIKAKSPWLLSKVSTSGHGTKKLDFAHLQNLELPQLSAEDLAQLDQVLIQIEELEQRKTKELEALKSLHHSLSTRAFAGQL